MVAVLDMALPKVVDTDTLTEVVKTGLENANSDLPINKSSLAVTIDTGILCTYDFFYIMVNME